MNKIAIKTLGCKANTFESEGIWQLFKDEGFIRVSDKQEADVYVINTCTVTNSGDKKSRQAIRRCVRMNPDAVIVVVGCYSQLNPDEVIQIEGVDIVLGTSKRDQIVSLVNKYLEQRQPIVEVSNIMKTKEFENFANVSFENKTRAFIKIQEGCNNFCTYCIIPWARGLIRSQDPKIIIEQINNLCENGFKEVVLTGIHTGGYGEDFESYSFADLLKDIEDKTNLERLRISSIEITQLDNEVLDIMRNSHIIVNHLHVPIQSANDKILKLMRRNYNLKEYKDKIKQLRSIFPDVSITTDIIVGFPNETTQDFEEILKNVEEINFSELHVFNYSPRTGTPAQRMDNQVDDLVKKARVKEIIQLNDKLALNYSKKFENEIVDVLVEEYKDGYCIGHTTNYLKVKFKSDTSRENEIVNVIITKSGYPINDAKLV